MAKNILDLKNVRILIVDDNIHIRQICRTLLTSFGAAAPYMAGNGDEALKVLLTDKVDIVLTDWEMDPIDGLDLARRIRAGEGNIDKFIPIIMMTSYSNMPNVNESRNAGINEFMCKPISAKALYLRIEEIILRPRQFVEVDSYFGPDRQRRDDPTFEDTDDRRGTNN